jgi:DNA-binding response OmpR family regulator
LVYAAIVLDIDLGTMSGFDVYDYMKNSGVAVPAIFISGQQEAARRRHGRTADAMPHLIKPFDGHALLAAVGDVLRLRPRDIPRT